MMYCAHAVLFSLHNNLRSQIFNAEQASIAEAIAVPVMEDPTPYTMDLISKEQLYGPHHPEVRRGV